MDQSGWEIPIRLKGEKMKLNFKIGKLLEITDKAITIEGALYFDNCIFKRTYKTSLTKDLEIGKDCLVWWHYSLKGTQIAGTVTGFGKVG